MTAPVMMKPIHLSIQRLPPFQINYSMIMVRTIEDWLMNMIRIKRTKMDSSNKIIMRMKHVQIFTPMLESVISFLWTRVINKIEVITRMELMIISCAII